MGLDIHLYTGSTKNEELVEIGYWRKYSKLIVAVEAVIERPVNNLEEVYLTKENITTLIEKHILKDYPLGGTEGYFYGNPNHYTEVEKDINIFKEALHHLDLNHENTIVFQIWF